MKKQVKIYVVTNQETGEVNYFINEVNAGQEAKEEKVSEQVFNNMFAEKVFKDMPELEPEQQPEPEKLNTQAEDIEELKKKMNDLLTILEEVKQENKQLKSKPRLSLDQAKLLYDKKHKLLLNSTIFKRSKEVINYSLESLNNVVDFEESSSYRLTLTCTDHSKNEMENIFGISNNLVITKVLQFVSNEVDKKINEISLEVANLENV